MRAKVAIAWVAFIMTSLLIAFAITVGIKRIKTVQESKGTNESFSLLLKKISPHSLNEITGDSAIVVYFNSECDHCKWEIAQIDANYKEFISYNFIFVSYEEPCDALNFIESHPNFKLLKYHLLYISAEKVLETFGAEIVPQILIYRHNKLQKQFKGETKISAITELI